MTFVKSGQLPAGSLLNGYLTVNGCYVDCYYVEVQGHPDLNKYLRIFFGTWLFQLELKILTFFGKNTDRNDQVTLLAEGQANSLAQWRVENRTHNDILLAVGRGPIRTWLHINPVSGTPDRVRLYFGSGMLPTATDRDGQPQIDMASRILLPFHKLYSRVLLAAAARKWRTSGKGPM